jgi:ribosomal protein S18 acetylase RimI-like enzyme
MACSYLMVMALEERGSLLHMKNPSISRNTATAEEILNHLSRTGTRHAKWIKQSIPLGEYALKLSSEANNIELWDNKVLVGLLAYYKSPANDEIFITNVSVDEQHQSKGLATHLLREVLEEAQKIEGVKRLRLEVDQSNGRALRIYERIGFCEFPGFVTSNSTRTLVYMLKG